MTTGYGRTGPPPTSGNVDEWGPSVERRGRRWGRTLLLVLVLALLLLLVAVPLLISAQIPRIPVEGLASGGGPIHVLVAGSDSREGLTAEEQRDLTTGSAAFVEGERTDTMFVMSIDGDDVALLSFPRDLWVTRCDGTSGRLNVAQSLGGPGCLVTTIRELSGIPISHYVSVTFGGFVDVVDAVNGVEICLEEAISDRDAGIDLPSGCQVLQGPDALGYVRVRKIDNDLQRIQRQQRFVQALARELTEPATLFDPAQMWSVSRSVGAAVAADDQLGVIDLGRIGLGIRGLATGNAPTFTVPSDPGTTSGGAEVLYPRAAEAEALFATFRNGSVFEASGSGPAPEDVQVVVENGAEVSGLAGRVEELLTGRGYDVTGIGNAEPRDATVILHPPGQRPGAERLRRDLPADAALQETSEVSTVTLVLGRDAAGLG